MSSPATITEGKRVSMPAPLPPSTSGSSRNVAMIAANAPVAPLIIPGRPPPKAHTKPTIHAE
eukprot:scaffold32490_cov58-Phaeocystis_antarctica.AAC.6